MTHPSYVLHIILSPPGGSISQSKEGPDLVNVWSKLPSPTKEERISNIPWFIHTLESSFGLWNSGSRIVHVKIGCQHIKEMTVIRNQWSTQRQTLCFNQSSSMERKFTKVKNIKDLKPIALLSKNYNKSSKYENERNVQVQVLPWKRWT